LSHFAVGVTDHWRLFVGIAFIAIMLFAPRGLVPIVKDKLARRKLDATSAPQPQHLPVASAGPDSLKNLPHQKEGA
jgi:hypothetical protein